MSQHSDIQSWFASASELNESMSTLGGDSLTVEQQMREMCQKMSNLEAKLECKMNTTGTGKPNTWSIPDDNEDMSVKNGRTIAKIGEDDQLASVRAKEPIGLHKRVQIGESKCHICFCPSVYFELRQKRGNGQIWIGLDLLTDGQINLTVTAAAAPFSNANSHVGAWAGSVGMNSQGHVWIDGVEKRHFDWEELEAGEFLVLGCGLVPSADGFELFFTRNGKLLGLDTLNVEDDQPQPSTVFPVVALSTHGTIVEANFGDCPAKRFHYKPDDHETQKKIREALLVAKQDFEQKTLIRVTNQHLDTSSKWNIQPNSGGLKANKTNGSFYSIRAVQPFPVAIALLEENKLFYFEVAVTWTGNVYVFIGLGGTDFPITTNSSVGHVVGSFAMRNNGEYLASRTSQSGIVNGQLVSGDVVGCGLLVLPTGRRLFFTKNGEIWSKPILLGADDAKADLHPIVSADEESATLAEFNFGGDLTAKPFKYPLSHLNVVDV